MHSYEAEQGLQYRERPVYLDSEIAGSIIVNVAQKQRELQETKDERQEVRDREVNANIQ